MLEEDEFDKTFPTLEEKKPPYLFPKRISKKNIKEAFEHCDEEPEHLVSQFILKNSVNMIYATDGIGKSVNTLYAMAQASSGVAVFGVLEVDRPLNVIYVVAERHILEPIHRLKKMKDSFTYTDENIVFTTEFQGHDLTNEESQQRCLEILLDIQQNEFNRQLIDIVVLDPIYALCGGDLKTDQDVNKLTAFFRKAQIALDCALILIHHENRGTYSQQTGKREGQDFYGNKFLSANCTSVWRMTKGTDRELPTQRLLKKEKDSYSCLLETIPLQFNEETMAYFIDANQRSKVLGLQIDRYIDICRKEDTKFTEKDLKKWLKEGCSIEVFRSVRKPLWNRCRKNIIKNCKPTGHIALYEVVKP